MQIQIRIAADGSISIGYGWEMLLDGADFGVVDNIMLNVEDDINSIINQHHQHHEI